MPSPRLPISSPAPDSVHRAELLSHRIDMQTRRGYRRLHLLLRQNPPSLWRHGERGEEHGKGFREELATLAKEVARLETVRVYAAFSMGIAFGLISWVLLSFINVEFLKAPCVRTVMKQCAFGVNSKDIAGKMGVCNSEVKISQIIFDDENKKFEEFRTEWVEKISVVILRGFDARSRDYVKNKKQWQKSEGGWTVKDSDKGPGLSADQNVTGEGLKLLKMDENTVQECMAGEDMVEREWDQAFECK
ncbi:hypothetical protein VNO77_19501 [Canavalia gladiata]|uniref:Uncharacterized protein n=1 Tax=Canavalia gladiata TaxID=3824 RepID=A0AAN9QKJ8_CANGL